MKNFRSCFTEDGMVGVGSYRAVHAICQENQLTLFFLDVACHTGYRVVIIGKTEHHGNVIDRDLIKHVFYSLHLRQIHQYHITV